jgi:hypothetical protein
MHKTTYSDAFTLEISHLFTLLFGLVFCHLYFIYALLVEPVHTGGIVESSHPGRREDILHLPLSNHSRVIFLCHFTKDVLFAIRFTFCILVSSLRVLVRVSLTNSKFLPGLRLLLLPFPRYKLAPQNSDRLFFG